MTFNLMLTLTESAACLKKFRSENFCQDGVVGWGERGPAEKKDQLKFKLIKNWEACLRDKDIWYQFQVVPPVYIPGSKSKGTQHFPSEFESYETPV